MSDKANSQEAPSGKRSSRLILGIAAALLVAGGGAASWYFAGSGADPATAVADAASRSRMNTVFVPLEQFTVNLADQGGERLAQIAVTLEVTDPRTEQSIKTRMPAIRNAILLQLSALESKELLTVTGKERLAERIAALTAHEMGWQRSATDVKVAAVHFSHFIIQ